MQFESRPVIRALFDKALIVCNWGLECNIVFVIPGSTVPSGSTRNSRCLCANQNESDDWGRVRSEGRIVLWSLSVCIGEGG
jgi:hypothetical protein